MESVSICIVDWSFRHVHNSHSNVSIVVLIYLLPYYIQVISWGSFTAMKCHSTQACLGNAGTCRNASGQPHWSSLLERYCRNETPAV